MPLPVIAGVSRVAVNWIYAEDFPLRATNVMHFDSGLLSPSDLVDALNANVQTHQFETMPDNVLCENVVVTPLDGVSGSFEGALPDWHGSSGVGDFSPAAGAVVSLKTAKRGRSYRGRIFLPFCVDTIAGAGVMDQANADELAAAWNDFGAAISGDGATPVVASYTLGTAEPVTLYTVDTVLGIQRRRQEQLRG